MAARVTGSATELKASTAVATPNIAIVKYWGNRDDELNLPYNSSISMTLDESFKTVTSFAISENLREDILYVNGERQNIGTDARGKAAKLGIVLAEMKKRAGVKGHALIVTKNYFPTSSGMASSASGGAAFVRGAADALGLRLSPREQSILARQVSGSASRSLFGGFVVWHKGRRKDGSDSYAEQVADERHWREVRDIVAIVDPGKKKVSSSEGHVITPQTSSLFKARPEVAESRVREAIGAIRRRDFDALARVAMSDSNSMHATMLDSWPPIIYLNDVSRRIIETINELNKSHGRNVAAYTFDAGPNAHILTTTRYAHKVSDVIESIEGVKEVIEAGAGSGPRLLIKNEALISESVMKKLVH